MPITPAQHCIITKLTIILKLFFYYAYDYIITVYILGQLNEPLKENKGSNNFERGERWTELRIHPCYNRGASWHSSRRKEKNSSRVLSVNPAHKSENCNAAEVGHLACLSKLKIKCVFCSQMWWIAEEFCNMWVFKSSSFAHKAPSSPQTPAHKFRIKPLCLCTAPSWRAGELSFAYDKSRCCFMSVICTIM